MLHLLETEVMRGMISLSHVYTRGVSPSSEVAVLR